MSQCAIGIDLGGTDTKIGIVDENGDILLKKTISTKVENGKVDVINRISECVNKLIEEFNNRYPEMGLLGIGIGSPGQIDKENGIVLFSPNFPDWRNFGVVPLIEERTKINAYIENDANSFVLGEWAFGNHKGSNHIIGLTLGTGVGSGVISHGQLITGYNGYASELGHMIIDSNGPICGCGSYGCVEAFASATAMIKYANESRKRFPDSLIFESDKINAKTILEAARNNDVLATMIFRRMVKALAIATGNFIHIFNPEVIIFGGGISRAGSFLLDAIKQEYKKYTMLSFQDTASIELSNLVEDAAIKGASSIVFYRLS
ncbi:MAG: ROK family protein [Kosmotoga sp.]|nr:MAG: ROK family protein [Kosmotoga sp.]